MVDPFPDKNRDHLSVLPRLQKVMDAENRVEDMGEEENRSLGKILQCPVLDTVRARGLADFDIPDCLVNLVSGD